MTPKEADVTFGGQLKQKVDEVHLQEKAKEFGDAVAEVVTAAVGLVAGYVKDNRSRLDDALDSAERFVNERTDGKHSETVLKVRSSVDQGVTSFVEHGTRDAETTDPAATDPAATVPDDVHSAFAEEEPGAATSPGATPGDAAPEQPGTPPPAD